MMSSCLALPSRASHSEHLYCIFKYIKMYHNTEIVFDPNVPVWLMKKSLLSPIGPLQ